MSQDLLTNQMEAGEQKGPLLIHLIQRQSLLGAAKTLCFKCELLLFCVAMIWQDMRVNTDLTRSTNVYSSTAVNVK